MTQRSQGAQPSGQDDRSRQAQEARRAELASYRQRGIGLVRVIGWPDACAACKAQHGSTFRVEDALAQMPVPCAACTNDWIGEGRGTCRCDYEPVVAKADDKKQGNGAA